MTRSSRQLLLPLLFLAILFALCAPTVARKNPKEDFTTASVPAQNAHQQMPIQDAASHSEARPGDLALLEAQAVLRKVQSSGRRSPRYTKPAGFLSNTWYYLKKVFTFLFLNTPYATGTSGRGEQWKSSKSLAKAVDLLQESAGAGNLDAIYTLADISLFGKYGYPRNLSQAFNSYERLATANGNGTAQQMLGFFYATGIGSVVNQDQAKAFLYHTFAAEHGDARALMTTAFRHHSGIATPRNCEKAVQYYKQVADNAMQYVRSGPPGGRSLAKDSFRLAEDDGGVYGEGASVSSSGINARQGGPTTDNHAAFDDVLEYLDLMSRKGELKATFGLAKLHYDGSRALKQDFRAARDFFLDIARRYWSIKDGKVKPDTEPGLDKLASKAAGYLGRMYLRGEGVEQNLKFAKVWFRRGIENGDALSQYSLGIMHLNGIGMPADPVKAADLFGASADQDFSSAQVRLGALMMDQGDLQSAIKYFQFAQRNGHIEALYYLAELDNKGVGRQRDCAQAVLRYKLVAEKTEELHASFAEANEAYEAGDRDAALLHYMLAAEQGYEIAQSNVAYILDKKPRAYDTLVSYLNSWIAYTPIPSFIRSSGTSGMGALASLPNSFTLRYWTRSAKQGNIDSLNKMGDTYLAGLSTSSPHQDFDPFTAKDKAPSPDKAAQCYRAAAETMLSAQAMWNLGWMHENGLGGMAQDFHLAKRYYDQALDTNAEAYLPVNLALIKLRLRSAWNDLLGGDVKSIRDDDYSDEEDAVPAADEEEGDDAVVGGEEFLDPDRSKTSGRRRGGRRGRKRSRSLSEWIADFLAADMERYVNEEAEMAAAQRDPDGLGAIAGMAGGEEFQQGGVEHGAEGFRQDDAYEIILDDTILETILIVGLAGALAALVYYRQMRRQMEEQQRAEEERRQRQAGPTGAAAPGRAGNGVAGPDVAAGAAAQGAGRADGGDGERGFFPPPGDPARLDWGAGGVGH